MKYPSILRWSVLVGLLCVPFISFIIAGTGPIHIYPPLFFPYITGKNFTFRILVEILLLAYTILAIKEPKYRPRSSMLMWTALAFAVWMALATVMSVDSVKSFWSNFERMDGYVTLIHAFVFFVIAGAMLTADKWWHIFFRATVVAGVLQGLMALGQVTGLLAISSQSGTRADTTFGNAIYVAVFMLFSMFITLYLLIRDRRSVGLQVTYGISLVIQFIALFYSQTRGATIGVVVGLIVVGIYLALRANQPEWRTVRMWSLGLLGALVLMVGLFVVGKDSSFVRNSGTLNRIASISLTDKTTQARFTIWRDMAIPGAMEKPIFGWGQENFSYIFNKYYVPSMYDQEQWFDRTHNEFLDWLVSGGIPAFILYILLFAFAAWAIIRSELNVPEQAVFLGLLAAYGFSNLTVFHDLISFVYFFVILAFLHGLSRNPLPKIMAYLKPVDDKAISIVAPILAVVILGGAWMLNAPGLSRAQELITAISPTDQKGTQLSPEQHLAAFKTALVDTGLGRQEAVEQLFQFASNGIAPSNSINPQTKQDVYAFTEEQGEILLAARPNDARLELFISVFYAQFGNYNEAVKHLEKAAALSPQKQQILLQYGSIYLQKGDVGKGTEILKKAFDLEPQYENARILYAGALYYGGNKAAGDKLLIDAFGTVAYDNDQLIQIYANTKQYDRIIAIWQARVAKNPKDANTMMGLAQAYFTSGNVAQTIATLQKIIQNDPAQAGQVQPIITQLQNGSLKPPTQ